MSITERELRAHYGGRLPNWHAQQSLARLDTALTMAVSRHLDCPVRLVRWIKQSTGDVPVFSVPNDVRARAIASGLTVEDES